MILMDWVGSVTRQEVKEKLLFKAESFTAGFISSRLSLFELYFKSAGTLTANALTILRRLQEGLPIAWVSHDHRAQQQYPRYAARLKLVGEVLLQTVGPVKLAGSLEGSESQAVHFKNIVSVQQHRNFVSDELRCKLALFASGRPQNP